MKLSATKVAEAINVPVSEWPGNCYGISHAVLHAGLVTGRLVYGHYLGPIKPKTLFSRFPIVRHGWIELTDGQVCDPTRWVFKGCKPYIHVGPDVLKQYDEGGNILRAKLETPPPVHDATAGGKRIVDKYGPLVMDLLGRTDNIDFITHQEALWLANLSLQTLGNLAAPLYDALITMGYQAFIPLDNRLKILKQ